MAHECNETTNRRTMMPETVCVTVSLSELKIIDEEIEFRTEANAMVERLLAQAERLRDWQPKVGDRVRLRAMPEKVGSVLRVKDDGEVQILLDGLWLRQIRYLAELMPEEETK